VAQPDMAAERRELDGVVSGRPPQAESSDAGGARRGDSLPDVVCLGETMAMVTPDPPCPLGAARSLTLSHGGAESNVAVWLARRRCKYYGL
jgi:hypothetical protein